MGLLLFRTLEYVRSTYFNYHQLIQNVANCCRQIYIDTSTTHGFVFVKSIMFATSILQKISHILGYLTEK